MTVNTASIAALFTAIVDAANFYYEFAPGDADLSNLRTRFADFVGVQPSVGYIDSRPSRRLSGGATVWDGMPAVRRGKSQLFVTKYLIKQPSNDRS